MPKGHWKCMGNITPRKVVFLTVNIFAVYVLLGFFYELAFCENIVTLHYFFSGSAIFSLSKQARFLQFRNLYIYLALPIWPTGAYILHSILDIFRWVIVYGHRFICSKAIIAMTNWVKSMSMWCKICVY